MDFLSLKTENQEYNIILKKEKKSYKFNTNTNYICSMIFINSINQPILSIIGTESDFIDLLDEFYDFNLNYGGIISNRFTFTLNEFNKQYSIFFGVTPEDLKILDSPSEEDLAITFFIEENYLGNFIERIKFTGTYNFLEELMYSIYKLIEDIPNVDMFFTSSILEYMIDFELDKMRYGGNI